MRYLMSIMILIVCFLLAVVTFVYADPPKTEDDHHMAPVTGSKELERLKTLVGRWQGTTIMDGKETPVSVIYETSSNGSIVVETLFPGTPHEMVSVYYDENGKLGMTHYCAINNQPHFTLKTSTNNEIDLLFANGTNLNPEKDGHMHAVDFTFNDKDNMVQEWKFFEDGKEKGVSTFTFTRAQQ